MATLPYWNNGEVISSDKLNSMVASIIAGDPLAVKVSNATKNDVNQIVGYLSSLHDKAKTNLNSATSTSDFDTAYTNMTALVSNKLGAYANDDTVDLYSTGIRASIITFLQAYDSMMSNDRLNNKNTDNTLGGRIDSEKGARENADNAIDTKVFNIQTKGGGRNLAVGTSDSWKTAPDVDHFNITTIATYTNAQAGDVFTVSVDTQSTKTLAWQIWQGSSQYMRETYVTSGDHWSIASGTTHSYTTFTWPSGATQYLIVQLICSMSDGSHDSYQYKKVMLEKGTVAHDWQPAPEDTNGAIENVRGIANNNTASIFKITSNGGGRNLLRYSTNSGYKFQPTMSRIDNYLIYNTSTVYMTQGQQYTVHAEASNGLVWSGTHNPNVESNNVVLWLTNEKDVSQIISDSNTGTGTTFTWNNPSGTYWLRVNTYKVDNSGYVDKVMLEKGIVAHDWSPSPQDVQSQIDNLNTNKISSSDVNWNLVATNSSNTYNLSSGSTINLPNHSSITVRDGRVIPHIYLPAYITDYLPNTDFNTLAIENLGEYDNLFIPSSTMTTLTNRPINPDTNYSLTGDCFFSNHYAYSGTNLRVMQKIYSCDYNYVFIRGYNGSSNSWTNWSCLTPYA